MFGVLWGTGFFGIFFCFMQKYSQKDKIQKFNSQKIKAVSRTRSTPGDLTRVLTRYIDEIFPIVYQNQSYFTRMIHEIIKHHRYIVLITTRGQDIDMKKVITCAYLLTIQTMLMFLLALCYELQVNLLFLFNY